MNEIPLYLFIFIMIVLFVLVLHAMSVQRMSAVVSAFVSVITAFTLSKISINGQLVTNYGHISTDNAMVFGTATIQNSAQSWIFVMVAIFMTIRLLIILIGNYKDVYGEVTE